MKNRDLRIAQSTRDRLELDSLVFETLNPQAYIDQAKSISYSYNLSFDKPIRSSDLYTTAVLHLVYQCVISRFIHYSDLYFFTRFSNLANKNEDVRSLLDFYDSSFPSEIFKNVPVDLLREEAARGFFVHQVMLENKALLKASGCLVNSPDVIFPKSAKSFLALMGGYSKPFENKGQEMDLFSFLTRPAKLFPDSLDKQLEYIRENWSNLLDESLVSMLFQAQALMDEQSRPHAGFGAGPGPMLVPSYNGLGNEEAYSPDSNWMPNVVLLAKSTLVWLDQLSKQYNRPISTLDQVPDSELDSIQSEGFTALWLIGLWERSNASRTIKRLCGNPEAAASAYSLKGYDIAHCLGGWEAFNNLDGRCKARGIRLASDMVPNHTGIDSPWVMEHDDYFMHLDQSPFPAYSFKGPDLSGNPDIEIKLEDHYYNQSDAAVVFRKHDKRTGRTTYIYHGNDGTSMPWNDTAQLDFLNPETREAIIQKILHVARAFHIIRFDAAMTLAKKHIQRLWYPREGCGADIASRSEHSMTDEQFNAAMPQEFWREVVDRIAKEAPDTLLLAEAFWMMEGFFVRTLGMHRVYNSAFMNMLKNQENSKFRDTIKATMAFDPEILKRYVNFMSNPDEDTAIAQFGDSERYFSICTIMSTLPGLPMFGHGQIEGYTEKYGMEYQKAYLDEKPRQDLIDEHERRIFPLLRSRSQFSGVDSFQFFDAYDDQNIVDSIYAYVNSDNRHKNLVLVNNSSEQVSGWIKISCPKMIRNPDSSRSVRTSTLAESLGLTFSPKTFVIYQDFSDKLYYIRQSLSFFTEGFTVCLDAYQSKVLFFDSEREDVDGELSELCRKLEGKGVQDLEKAIRAIELEPYYQAMERIKSDQFQKHLKTIIHGETSLYSQKKFFYMSGESFSFLEELNFIFERLQIKKRRVTSEALLKGLKAISKVCLLRFSKTGNLLVPQMPQIFTTAILLMPFVSGDTSLQQAIMTADALMLADFLGTDEMTVRLGCLLSTSGSMSVESLLQDQAFRDLIGCNKYEGITWYNGDAAGLCIYIVHLANAIKAKNLQSRQLEKSLAFWYKKDKESKYILDNLISKEKDK